MARTIEHPLKTWREAQSLTQAELARRLNCPQALISKIETGERQASGRMARLLDEVSGGYVSRHWLRPDIFGVPAAGPVLAENKAA